MSKVFSDVEECVEKGILIGREGEKKLRSEAEVDDAISEGADKFLHGVLLKRIVAVKFGRVYYIGQVVKYRKEDGNFNVGHSRWGFAFDRLCNTRRSTSSQIRRARLQPQAILFQKRGGVQIFPSKNGKSRNLHVL